MDDSIVLGIVAIIIGGLLFILFARSRSKDNDDNISADVPPFPGPYQPQPDPEPQFTRNTGRRFTLAELRRAEAGKYSWDDSGTVFEVNTDGSVTVVGHFDPAELSQPACGTQYANTTGRQFTLAELRRAETGKYSWDESGTVFEINTDGSVTIVGHFDPAELLIDPVEDLYEKLVEDGLPDMLPSLWSYIGYASGEPHYNAHIAYNDTVLSFFETCLSFDFIKDAAFPVSPKVPDQQSLVRLICEIGSGIIFLLPHSEKEFLFALGAQSCLRRHFADKLKVIISSPAVIGALWTGVVKNSDKLFRISYAYSNGDYYQCCNMTVENGVYEVNQILTSSIIQPDDFTSAIYRIFRGCMTYYQILTGNILKDIVLIDANPYPVSLMELENGRTVKIYELADDAISIPGRLSINDLTITRDKTLALVFGSSVLIDDIATTMEISDIITSVTIEIFADSTMTLLVKTPSGDRSIDLGGLIG